MAKKSSIQEMATEWIETKSEKKFVELVKRLTPGMHKHIIHLEKNPTKRIEILNDAFSKVWSKSHSYNVENGAFSTWVYKIVYNEALLTKRHTNRTSSLDEIVETGIGVNSYINNNDLTADPAPNFDETDPESVIDDLYDAAILAINSLSTSPKHAKWKQALIMKEIEGKQFNQIAEILKTNENTVKGWVCKARRQIVESLQSSNPTMVANYKKLKRINEKSVA